MNQPNPNHVETLSGNLPVSPERRRLLQKIREKVKEIRSYTPKVGVFGVTGVGKSSLCNALFGQDAAKVSDVAACTREPQELFISNEHGTGIKLIDVPGISETKARNKEYFELYKKLMPELDLVLWVIKADDRAYAEAQEAYEQILKPHSERCPTVFIINQVDKLNPIRDWNDTLNRPGEKQQVNVNQKLIEVSKAFDVSTNHITAVSVEMGYNLVTLMDAIVEALPNEKKFSVAREAKEEVKNEEIILKAEKGIWDSIKETAGDAWDSVKDFVQDTMIETAKEYSGKAVELVTNSVKSLFKKWF